MKTLTEIYHRLLQPGTEYGHGDHWKPVLAQIGQAIHSDLQLRPMSLLDVGAGRGGLIARLRSELLGRFTACDLAPCEAWIEQAALPALPYNNGEYSVVTCFDVLEHLPEYQVAPAIEELIRVCRHTLIISIAECSDAREIDGERVELHLTRQPLAWWLSHFDPATVEVLPVADQPEWRHYMRVTL